LTRPTLTPDQVKELLTGTAKPLVGVDAIGQGAGRLDLNAAAMAATPTTATQSFVKAPRLSALMDQAATPCSRDDDGAASVGVRRCRLAVAS
jgi:hypothetical protein